MSEKQYPSIDLLRQCFRYEDGKVFWLERPRSHFLNNAYWVTWNKRYAGKEAGSPLKSKWGHRYCIALAKGSGKFYRATIVWALHTGSIVRFLDHKNRISHDDRIDNLRIATGSQNGANKSHRSDNRSGYKGVWQRTETKSKRWCAEITVNHRKISLGTFDTPQEAHAAYCEAAQKHFGDFAYGASIP